ncbi:PGAP3/PER1 family protein [Aspergillus candidus]|uniref:Post-GPI attachment to proteins factor 3 n=1 Tax=Aspergillus candidus TaxID=41067 RepID=A0A2I2F7H4_ASPCN|nr:Mn2+ homeostasis protein [Aspergillus candidus]PLB36580.1 Mn2+ homeostasis protein [Aspergillus candidus]
MMLVSRKGTFVSLLSFVLFAGLIGKSSASLGDHLPDFRECVEICKTENCNDGESIIPFHLRLMLWTCPAECDYTCQHIVTDRRVARDPPMITPVVQFHGKWPFRRILGMQEPFSVLFSILNFLAHWYGMGRIREIIPAWHSLRKYYIAFGYCGLACWTFSTIFHTRDFAVTEKLDYFGAGANVMYGLYLAVIRILRLDQEEPAHKPTLRRLLTASCILLYTMHVCYLSFWSWDYTYNMIANIVIGMISNVLWVGFSVSRYQKQGNNKPWTLWPALIVAWIMLAMSLELLDFAPWHELIDAHSLWHLGTVIPTLWWYLYLVKDVQDDVAGDRLKA